MIASLKRNQSYDSDDPDDWNLPVVRGMAVSTNVDPPSSPCGMCRQFIKEFCGGEMRVWMYGGRWDEGERDGVHDEGGGERRGTGKVVEVMTIEELLPMSFGRKDLKPGSEAQRTP